MKTKTRRSTRIPFQNSSTSAVQSSTEISANSLDNQYTKRSLTAASTTHPSCLSARICRSERSLRSAALKANTISTHFLKGTREKPHQRSERPRLLGKCNKYYVNTLSFSDKNPVFEDIYDSIITQLPIYHNTIFTHFTSQKLTFSIYFSKKRPF